jgi:hypothetical protein
VQRAGSHRSRQEQLRGNGFLGWDCAKLLLQTQRVEVDGVFGIQAVGKAKDARSCDRELLTRGSDAHQLPRVPLGCEARVPNTCGSAAVAAPAADAHMRCFLISCSSAGWMRWK